MSDHDESKHRKSDSSAWLPLAIGLINALVGAPKEENADDKYRKSQERSNRLTANATITMAAVTAAILAVGVFGYFLSWHQLNVMQGQLDVMEADQRPWIKIDSVSLPKNKIGIPDGLRFWRNETFPSGIKSVTTAEGNVQLTIDVAVTNIGKAPAFDVEAGIWPLLGYAERIDLVTQERKSCDGLKPAIAMPMIVDNDEPIRTIFPRENTILHPALFLLPDRVRKLFQLWFYGCVTYNIDRDRRRQTGFGYRVSQTVQTAFGPAQREDFDPGINIPASALHLEPRPLMAPDTN